MKNGFIVEPDVMIGNVEHLNVVTIVDTIRDEDSLLGGEGIRENCPSIGPIFDRVNSELSGL